jgi:hypothetical protein
MQKRNRTQLVLGLLLIIVAGWLIATRINPSLANILNIPEFSWPMWVILSGALLLVIGLLVGAPGMAIPACIVAGIGGILYYQNVSGNWASWAYLWTLIPGFVGIGSILAGLLGDNMRESVSHGLNALLVSIIMFAVFASIFGGWTAFGPYTQYVLIGLLFIAGIWFIVRAFLHRK